MSVECRKSVWENMKNLGRKKNGSVGKKNRHGGQASIICPCIS